MKLNPNLYGMALVALSLASSTLAQDFDLNAAYAYLKQSDVPARSSAAEVLAAKEGYMSRLDQLEILPPDLIDTYLDLAQDKKQDIGTRHYAIQHLRAVYERNDVSAEDKARILTAIFKAAEEDEEGLAGTALLQLRMLAAEDPQGAIDKEKAKSLAVNYSKDDKANQATRISALQVAAMMGGDVRNTAKQIAKDKKKNVNLRLSAIGALGICGDSSDKADLDGISKGQGEAATDQRLKDAAKEAMDSIDEKAVKAGKVGAE